jgi:hypothetical protein
MNCGLDGELLRREVGQVELRFGYASAPLLRRVFFGAKRI